VAQCFGSALGAWALHSDFLDRVSSYLGKEMRGDARNFGGGENNEFQRRHLNTRIGPNWL